ncbi:S9 family peptidase [Dactylosporangium roseum]|uniref:S9 family peptidase n=1 Tax=Dactylosporangium roseum TaxID=47989 RepID=A0ABY5Z699_9ACTN|nr:prolyl oligopeptidase family serine peptidase [Dactylosporangium roseum]UWZ36583.1 S9 family peptidase [Dactylosporangium roseum]
MKAVDLNARPAQWLQEPPAMAQALHDGSVIWEDVDDNGDSWLLRSTTAGRTDDVLSGIRPGSNLYGYGGGAWLMKGRQIVYVDKATQQLFASRPDGVTTALTRAAPPGSVHLGDLACGHPGRAEVMAVRHLPASGRSQIISVDTTGRGETILVDREACLAWPTASPDGHRLAWVEWLPPDMPWDRSRLMILDTRDGIMRSVLAEEEAVSDPLWSREHGLTATTDRTGWWLRWSVPFDGTDPHPLIVARTDMAMPRWSAGQRSAATVDGGTAVVHGASTSRLGLIASGAGNLTPLGPSNLIWQPYLHASGRYLAGIAGSEESGWDVAVLDLRSARLRMVGRRAPQTALPAAEVHRFHSDGRSVECILNTPNGHGPFPAVVFAHSGPTAHAQVVRDREVDALLTHGIAVIRVNYTGSSGYGRDFRHALYGQWGRADVQDCIRAVDHLARLGRVDGQHVAIRGKSAGGWTAMHAAATDRFRAAVAYYGVSDAHLLSTTTHPFERGYVRRLAFDGKDHWFASPLQTVDAVKCPVLLVQGDEDQVVPIEQAQMYAQALWRRQRDCRLLILPGEGHGIRAHAARELAIQAETDLYQRMLLQS